VRDINIFSVPVITEMYLEIKYTVDIFVCTSLDFPLFYDPADTILLTQSYCSWALLFCL